MSPTKAVAFYMLTLAALAAFFLGAAPLSLWIRLFLAGLVVGIEIGIPVSVTVVRIVRGRNQRRRYFAPD